MTTTPVTSPSRLRSFLLSGLLLFGGVAVAQPALSLQSLPDGRVQLRWAKSPAGFALETASALQEPIVFLPANQTPADEGAEFSLLVTPADATQFYRLRQIGLALPVRVDSTSPAFGEGGVAVTRETVIRFDGPLAENTLLGADSLFAEAAGRRLLTRTELATDRRAVSLFYQEPLPGGSRVTVTLNGDSLRDATGFELDPDGDTVPGGSLVLSFDTMNNVAVGATAVIGRVFASEKNPDGSDRPLAGVTITVNGVEETLRAVTAADGSFVLQPAPAGRCFVQVDGRTAQGSQWPVGAYYPFVGKAWSAIPGRTDNLAGGNGLIYLPFIQPDALQPVSTAVETRITFAPSVLAANPALAGVEIMVPPNALFADNGARGGMVGIAPVPADRLPEPLPAGLVFPLVITIQTDGPSNFDRPVPVKFPNLPDPVTGEKLPPGAKTALWSFNHDTGRWEIQGSMTITPDGNFAVTDPGIGVRQPGWHGGNPGSGGGGPDDGGGSGSGGGGDGDGDDDCEDSNANGVCDDDDEIRCEKEILDLLFNGLDCAQTLLPGADAESPLAACAKTVATSIGQVARNCNLDMEGCELQIKLKSIETVIGCLKELPALKNIKPFIEAAEKLKCLLDTGLAYASLQQCRDAIPPGSRSAGSIQRHGAMVGGRPSSGNPFLQQYEIEDSFGQVFTIAYGNPKWAHIQTDELPLFSAILEAVDAAVAAGGDAGFQVSAAEASALLALPRPVSTTAADVTALADRFSRLSLGQLSAAEFDVAAWAAAADRLAAISAEVEAEGWQHIHEGHHRGHALLVAMLAAQVTTGAVVGNSTPVPAAVRHGVTPNGKRDLPDRALFYLVRDLETGFELRGRLNAAGNFDGLILRPQAPYLVAYLDPETARSGLAYFQSGLAGRTTLLPSATLVKPPALPDADEDRLSDLGELVLGTRADQADSDGDGVSDAAELANDTNPLDNSPLSTGVVASVDTPGTALDVAVVGNIGVVAAGPAGFSVLDLSDPFAPVLMAQMDLATSPKAVAVSGDRALLATGFRFYVADISVPTAPVLVAEVALAGVNRVAVAGRTGFVTSGTKLRAVDLLNGATLGEVTLPSTISDLAVTRDLVLALTGSELRVFRFNQLLPGDPVELLPLGVLAITGSIAPLEDGRRLFAAGNRAYAGYFQGYSIINLTDPAAPALLGKEPATQAAIHDFAADGSGQLVAVTSFAGEGTLAVSLYDVRDDGDVTKFLTFWNTPGEARALTLHRGLAFVADSLGGILTVNFRAADTGTNAPTITLEPLLSAPGVAEAGGNLRLVANTTDDVLVRDVEFYLDGALVATDGGNPFEWHGVAPVLTTTKTNFTVRAKATDTGGNSRWSDELVIALRDTTGPRVVQAYPPNGFASASNAVRAVGVVLDGPANPATVNAGSLTLTNAGPDRKLGTADDVAVTRGTPRFEPTENRLELAFVPPLNTGLYRARLDPAIADTLGNTFPAPVVWTFEILPPPTLERFPTPDEVYRPDTLTRMYLRFGVPMNAATLNTNTVQVLTEGLDNVPGNADDAAVAGAVNYDAGSRLVTFVPARPLGISRYTARFAAAIAGTAGNNLTNDVTWRFDVRGPLTWTNDSGGLWSVAANWSSGRTPNRDYVLIDRPTAITTTNQAGTINLRSLTSEESFTLTGSTLLFDEPSVVNGTLTVGNNGRISTASRLTANGPLRVSGITQWDGGGALDVAGEAIFGGTGELRVLHHTLNLAGPATWTGGGFALRQTNSVVNVLPTGVFEINRTNSTSGFNIGTSGRGGRLHNLGTVRKLGAAGAGEQVTFSDIGLANDGLLEVREGTLTLDTQTTTNRGRIEVAAGAHLHLPTMIMPETGSISGAGAVSFDQPGRGLNVNSLFLAGSYEVSGPTVVNQPMVFSGPFSVNAFTVGVASPRNVIVRGPAQFNGPVQVSSSGGLVLESPATLPSLAVTQSGQFEVNSNNVVIAGPLVLDNGGLIVNGTLQVSGPTEIRAASFFTSRSGEAGLLLLTNVSVASRLSLDSDLITRLLPGSTLTFAADSLAEPLHGPGVLENGGTVVVPAKPEVLVTARLENLGVIHATAATNRFSSSSQHTGELLAGANTVVFQGAGENHFQPGSRLEAGRVIVEDGGTVDRLVMDGELDTPELSVRNGRVALNVPVTVASLTLTGGIGGTGQLTVTSNFTWAGGSIIEGLRVRNEGQLVSSGVGSRGLGVHFENAGDMLVTHTPVVNGGRTNLFTTSGRIHNQAGASLELQTPGEFRTSSGAGEWGFLNEGELRKTVSTNSLIITGTFTNRGLVEITSGPIEFTLGYVQESGVTRLNGGSLGCYGPPFQAEIFRHLLLSGGELTGVGLIDLIGGTSFGTTVSFIFTNSATVRPGNPLGVLTVNARYRQTSAGTLAIELGGTEPGTGYDQLVVEDDVRVAGRLVVTLVNGFVPALGDRFLVVKAESSATGFEVLDLPDLGSGKVWKVSTSVPGLGAGLVLEVIAAP